MIYIFTLINFALLFAATIIENVRIGGANEAVFSNSPQVIFSTTLVMTLIGIFMCTAFVNAATLRDFEHKFDGLMFTTSITKFGYLSGRFLAAFLASLIPFLGIFLGIILASFSPWVNADDIGPFQLSAYTSTFFYAVIPNVFIICSIVFSFAALFKSTLYSFIGAMMILVLYLFGLSIINNLESDTLTILSDPLLINAHDLITKYWTIMEKNTKIISFSGFLLINRLLWVSLSIGLLLLTYSRFSFSRKTSKKKSNNKEGLVSYNPIQQILTPLPQVDLSDRLPQQVTQFLHQVKVDTKGTLRSTPFIILILLGIFNMSGAMSNVDQTIGTGNHPVTYLMVDAIRNSLYIFAIAILLYFSGALIWKERDAKMNEFFDATPMATWIPYAAKLSTLILTMVSILVIAIINGVIVQVMNGYYNFELTVYFKELLIFDLLQFTFMIALAMFVQTIVNNKYIGYFVFLIAIVLLRFAPQALEINSNLFIYGSVPSHIYSDMNAWSIYENGLAWFNIYWALFATILSIAGILFWVRGKNASFSNRWSDARNRFKGNIVINTAVIAALWLGTTGFLFYQTKIQNTILSSTLEDQRKVDYEIKYKKYQHHAQPRITSIDFNIDIYPAERNFSAQAKMWVRNKTEESIPQLFFSMIDNLETTISIKGANETRDPNLPFSIFDLETPLGPGDSMIINVMSVYNSQGIENELSNTDIVQNGTFLSNFKMIPTIGYATSMELDGENSRAKYNLAPKPRMAKLHANCGSSCQNNYIVQDADWVTIKSTISTSLDQLAIAPGNLTKEWESDNRKYYTYELNQPVLNFYSFISGKYEVDRSEWIAPDGKKVDIEVYYHKGHEYNVGKMSKAMKHSLEYFSSNFSPYPHKQARIIEFPRYEKFAQAFPGTMPYSEAMGFIANLETPEAVDMVYFTVAHEMAHQWWGHQVVGADVQGVTMLSETFAQYSAMMVMKEAYGNDKMKQLMIHTMDTYLRQRSNETNHELPLLIGENQQYVHYAKGALVMFALQDYLGEETINTALRKFAEDKAYQEAPYTNTLEFMDYLEAETPDSLQYLLNDMISSITLYNNKTTNATFQKLDNGKYQVNIEVQIEKYAADSLGTETLIPHDDYIDIGIFSEEKTSGHKYRRPLLLERVKISESEANFSFIVDELPYEAGIDPNYLLVDRIPGDNLKKLEEI